jgi:hypothetical protein
MSESTETALKEPSSSEGNAEKTGNEKIVEAGSIDKLEEVVKTGNPKHWNENKFNAVVRYFLGSLLLVFVFGLIFWHYMRIEEALTNVSKEQMELAQLRVKTYDDFFSKWFPAVSALLGTAISFFFSRSHNGSSGN